MAAVTIISEIFIIKNFRSVRSNEIFLCENNFYVYLYGLKLTKIFLHEYSNTNFENEINANYSY